MYHTTLSYEKWQSLLLVEQLANVGSEVERAMIWRAKNQKYMKLALFRALELIDLTLKDTKNREGLREITRIREFIIDYFLGSNQYGSSDAFWKRYFMAYTVASGKNRKLRIL